MHFIGPDQYHGFEARLTADIYPADYAWVPNWGREDNPDVNDPRTLLTSGICERNVQIDYDEEVTFKAIQHLYDLARSRTSARFPAGLVYPSARTLSCADKSSGTSTRVPISLCPGCQGSMRARPTHTRRA